MLRINKDKPIELMQCDNERVIKLKVGSIHCTVSNLAIVRKLWNKRISNASRELKRGWIKCVLEAHIANQDLYIRVMCGRL